MPGYDSKRKPNYVAGVKSNNVDVITTSSLTGAVKVRDSGAGSMAIEIYADAADTQPGISIASTPNTFSIAGILSIGPGGSTAPDVNLYRPRKNVLGLFGVGNVGCTLASVSSDVNSPANTSENDLYSASPVLSGLLGANGDLVDVSFFGNFANNARTKRFRLYFGGSLIADSAAMAFAGSTSDTWQIDSSIVRDATTAVRCSTIMTISGSSTAIKNPLYTRLTGLSDMTSNASAIRLSITVGSGASSADVILKAGKIKFVPA